MSRSKIILLYSVGAGLLAFAAIILLLVIGGEQVSKNKTLLNSSSLVPAGSGQSNVPQGDEALIVPDERVPKTVDQVAAAAPLTTLPSRMSAKFNPDQTGPQSDAVDVPQSERRSIMTSVGGFLINWDSFLPSAQIGSAVDKNFLAYKNRIRPWSAPGGADALADRADVRSPCVATAGGGCDRIVCPNAGCLVGSVYQKSGSANYADQTGGAFTVRAIEGNRAWVTGYGKVEYISNRGHPLDSRIYRRAYSLLLRKVNGRWLVDKAASESIREVS